MSAAWCGAALVACASAADPTWRVERVIDGDTLVVIDAAGRKETVRLIGIDAPERGEYGADEATSTLRERCGKGALRLAADPTGDDRDTYKRLLRYVFAADGALLNAELVRAGAAYAYTRFPFERRDEFRALEEKARDAGLGVWRAGGTAELEWLRKAGREPFRVQATTDRSWAVEYGCLVKTHVRPEQLARTLARAREWVAELPAGELRARLLADGYLARPGCP